MRKTRIAVVSDNLVFGGINRYCLDLVRELREDPHLKTYLLAPDGCGGTWLPTQADQHSIDLRLLPMRARYSFSAARAIEAFLRDKQIDIVHSQGYRSNLICRAAVRAGRFPVKEVCTAHGVYSFGTAPFRSKLYYALDYFTMRWIDRVIAVSEATRRDLLKWGIDARKIAVVHNGTRLPSLDENDPVIMRERWSISPGMSIVGFVGRLAKEKGVETLAEVADRLFAAGADVTFLVVGDGALRPTLDELADHWGSRVILAGHQREVARFYSVMDILLLPSHTEGLPMAALEAMAFGVPVVASHVGGMPEVVAHGSNGLLCPFGDVDCLVESCLALLTDQETRATMGRNARRRVEEEFATEKMVDQTRAVYRGLVQ